MSNTATLYDVTNKEYLHLEKVGDGFFTGVPPRQIIDFLTRVRYGHDIRIYYDSKGHPEKFYDDDEFLKWSEIESQLDQKIAE